MFGLPPARASKITSKLEGKTMEKGETWSALETWYGIVGFNVPLDTIIGHFGDDFTGQ